MLVQNDDKLNGESSADSSGSEKSLSEWKKSPVKEQANGFTYANDHQEHLLPPASDASVITRLHGMDTTHQRPSYDWSYTPSLRPSETANWWDMTATAAPTSSRFVDMNPAASAIPYSSYYGNTLPDADYGSLASSAFTGSLMSSNSLLAQPTSSYLSSLPDTFRMTANSMTTGGPSLPSAITAPVSAPPPPSTTRSRRQSGRSVCACPNCRRVEQYGSASLDPKLRGQHSCHIAGCGKVYSKTSHLKAHLRWHTGDRPFVCNWSYCGKRFTQSDELQHHLKSHKNDPKYLCSACNKKFAREDHLAKHMKVHQDSLVSRPAQDLVTSSEKMALNNNNNDMTNLSLKQEKKESL